MKSLRKRFEVGQKINTLRVTDNNDIVKVREFAKVGYEAVQFKGIRGLWKYKSSKYGDGNFFYSGDCYLQIIKL